VENLIIGMYCIILHNIFYNINKLFITKVCIDTYCLLVLHEYEYCYNINKLYITKVCINTYCLHVLHEHEYCYNINKLYITKVCINTYCLHVLHKYEYCYNINKLYKAKVCTGAARTWSFCPIDNLLIELLSPLDVCRYLV